MIASEIRTILKTFTDIDLHYCFGNLEDANSKSEEVENGEYFFVLDENSFSTSGSSRGLPSLNNQNISFRLMCFSPNECDEQDDDFEQREDIFNNCRFYTQKVLSQLAKTAGYKDLTFTDGFRNKGFKDKMSGYFVDVNVIKVQEIFNFC